MILAICHDCVIKIKKYQLLTAIYRKIQRQTVCQFLVFQVLIRERSWDGVPGTPRSRDPYFRDATGTQIRLRTRLLPSLVLIVFNHRNKHFVINYGKFDLLNKSINSIRSMLCNWDLIVPKFQKK